MSIYYENDQATIYHGNNLDILPTLPDNSVDAIVTDPPYELGFMGKKWDNTGIAYSVELWTECLRVLKPGGHLLSFGGTRTWHRVAVAIEDAGFEVRDSIAWMYGSGFPKSLDVSKAIDKASGFEGEIIGTELVDVGMQGGNMHAGRERSIRERSIEAEQWQGWGTALKPAFEPIVVARKPLIGTVAANVLEHGTGALNIDGSRIGTNGGNKRTEFDDVANNEVYGSGLGQSKPAEKIEGLGRWPANVILDEYTAEILDGQAGISKSPKSYVRKVGTLEGSRVAYENIGEKAGTESLNYGDFGGASRFYYCAKASKTDRNEGLDNLQTKQVFGNKGGTYQGLSDSKIESQNFHPTVKPTALMRYLIKLVTPPNGVVLDPFTGSGSTGKAALLDGFQFIGIEMTDEYLPIIKGRLEFALNDKTNDGHLF